uniref:SGNH/GDSL hydrolase family protein n=1 Tax=Porphyrobacter sp. GA68 TaxID=2883480 RepID=UPI001D18E6A0|nr:SGNH/GDSL hydrolase family protein [Porphyrobacter sp. GA68]
MTWGGNYTGMYKAARPDIVFHGKAVGGSGIRNLETRLPTILALEPDMVTIFIGANDLASYENASAYLMALRSYIEKIKATGAKVVIATVLPQQLTDVNRSAKHNVMRKELANFLRQATWVDGLVDFAADPEMGPDEAALNKALYTDGLHPTDGTHGVGEGGQVKLYRVFKPVVDQLLKDVR